MKTHIKKCNPKEWAKILSGFSDSNIYQTIPYGIARWGIENIIHIITYQGSDIIAAGQAHLKKVPFTNIKIAHMLWGPVWKTKELKVADTQFNFAIRSMRDEITINNKITLRLVPRLISSEPSSVYPNILKDEGYEYLISSNNYRTLMLDITPSLDDLRRNLRKDWKNKINRAKRYEVSIKVGSGDDYFLLFMQLYNEMRIRKSFKEGVNIEQFKNIQIALESYQKLKIIVGSIGPDPVSALIWSELGDTAVTLLRATGKKGLDSGASQYISFKMIEYLKESEIKYLDLGGINPESNPGTYKYKSGLAGEKGEDVQFIGTYYSYPNALTRRIFPLAENFMNKK